MQDLTVRGAAVDATLRAMPYLIAAHLENKHVDGAEREDLLKASEAIARWIKEEDSAQR